MTVFELRLVRIFRIQKILMMVKPTRLNVDWESKNKPRLKVFGLCDWNNNVCY